MEFLRNPRALFDSRPRLTESQCHSLTAGSVAAEVVEVAEAAAPWFLPTLPRQKPLTHVTHPSLISAGNSVGYRSKSEVDSFGKVIYLIDTLHQLSNHSLSLLLLGVQCCHALCMGPQ